MECKSILLSLYIGDIILQDHQLEASITKDTLRTNQDVEDLIKRQVGADSRVILPFNIKSNKAFWDVNP